MAVYVRKTRSGKPRYTVKVQHQDQQHHGGTFDTRAEAKRADAALSNRLHEEGNPSRMTVTVLRARWLESISGSRRASTLRNYAGKTKRFSDTYGDRLVSKVSREEAIDWVTAPRRGGDRAPLRGMFNYAVDRDILRRNPFDNIRIEGTGGRKDITPPTVAEVQALADAATAVHGAAYGPELRAYILTAAFCGLRVGELAVLQWSDIDFRADRIHVTKTLSDDREVLPPKNGKNRTVVLAPQARDALQAMTRHLGRGHVFGGVNGSVLTKSARHYAFNPVRLHAGQPNLDLHELRHFCATHLMHTFKLRPSVVAHQLGHTDGGRLVMRLYAHLDNLDAVQEVHEAYAREHRAPTSIADVPSSDRDREAHS